MAEASSIIPGGEIEAAIAENYRAIVGDPERHLTYNKLAEQAEGQNSPELAAWARREAAGKNIDVTPDGAKPTPDKVTTRKIGKDTHAVDEAETPRSLPAGSPATGVPYEYDSLTLTELKELADQRNIDQADLKLKADYVAVHELWDEQDGTTPVASDGTTP